MEHRIPWDVTPKFLRMATPTACIGRVSAVPRQALIVEATMTYSDHAWRVARFGDLVGGAELTDSSDSPSRALLPLRRWIKPLHRKEDT
jgi:hypothetical protein